jgi:transposase
LKSFERYKQTRDRSTLPDDPETLKDIIETLYTEFEAYKEKTNLLMAQMLAKIEALEHEIAVLKKNRFGRRSEKRKEKSSSKPPSSSSADTPSSPDKTPSTSQAKNQNHPGRHTLPPHLERVRVEHDLSPEEKICPECQGLMTKIKEILTEQLDVMMESLFVTQQVRYQYACRQCYSTIKTSALPAVPIEKGKFGTSLLAHLMIQKFEYYLPYYRLEKWFDRQGVPTSRMTISTSLIKAAFLLEPIVNCFHDMIQKGDHIFTDDTTMPTLDPGTGKTKTGRIWVYTQKEQEGNSGVTVYTYTPSRHGKYPQDFLKNFKGYVQADAFSGLNALFTQKDDEENLMRKEVGCWAHSRRKFVDVLTYDPHSIATTVVDWIGDLYAIEDRAKKANLSDEQRRWLRRNQSKPILKKIRRWLKQYYPKVVPKSALGQAMAYVINNWRALTRFLEDGKLEIDNNRSERKIKTIVIGRKNHLFVGSEEGGKAAAIIYSIIETCRQNSVDPFLYLKDVLERVSTHPNSRIDELLPANWKKRYDPAVTDEAKDEDDMALAA